MITKPNIFDIDIDLPFMYKVLQVDDEELILDLTSTFLGMNKEFTFRSESTAEAALTALSEESFDAIVSDHQA